MPRLRFAVLAALVDWAWFALADFWDWLWGMPLLSLWPFDKRLTVSVFTFAWSLAVGAVQDGVEQYVHKKTKTRAVLVPDWSRYSSGMATGFAAVALLLGVCASGVNCYDRFATAMLIAYLTLVALAAGTSGTLGMYRSIRRGVVFRCWWWTWPLTLMVLLGMFLALLDTAATLADYQIPWTCTGSVPRDPRPPG